MDTVPHLCTCPPPCEEKAQDTPRLLPYLGLKARLFLAPIAHPIIAILIVAVRLFSLTSDATQATADTKESLLGLCRTLDSALSTAPAVAAAAASHLVNLGLNATIDGLASSLTLAVTVMEGIIIFIIRMYKSTFLCFLNLAVRGSLDAVIDGVNKINTELNTTMASIKGNIQGDVVNANNVIDTFFKGLNTVGNFFGGSSLSPPSISIPSLNALNNVNLPATFVTDLQKLNSSLPTLDDVENRIEQLVELPFENLKSLISTAITSLKGNISVASTSPGVAKAATGDFCDSQMDLSFVDDLGAALVKAAHVVVALLFLLLFAMVVASLLWTCWEWHCLQQHVRNTQRVWRADSATAPSSGYDDLFAMRDSSTPLQHNQVLEMITVSSHPRIHLWGIRLAQRLFPNNISAQYRVRWFIGVAIHPSALLCLFIGVIGLLAITSQLVVLDHLQSATSSNLPGRLSILNATLTKHATDSLVNSTSRFANTTNGQISQSEAAINEEIFGWVNVSTTAVNNTLNAFVDDLVGALNTTLGGTVLYTPALDVMNCLLLVKIRGIQAGLDFISSNAQVTLPRINATEMANSVVNGIGNDVISSAGSRVTSAGPNGGGGSIEAYINQLFRRYAQKLRNEVTLYVDFLCIWLFVVLVGLMIVVWDACLRQKWQRRQTKGSASGGPWSMSSMWDRRTPSTTFLESKSRPRLRAFALVERMRGKKEQIGSSNASSAFKWKAPAAPKSSYQAEQTTTRRDGWKFEMPQMRLPRRQAARPTTMHRTLVQHDAVRDEYEMGMSTREMY